MRCRVIEKASQSLRRLFVILPLRYSASSRTGGSLARKEGLQSQESWVLSIGPHPSWQVFLHSGLRDEELPVGVHSRLLSRGQSGIPTSGLTAVFPASGAAHSLYLEPWNF